MLEHNYVFSRKLCGCQFVQRLSLFVGGVKFVQESCLWPINTWAEAFVSGGSCFLTYVFPKTRVFGRLKTTKAI